MLKHIIETIKNWNKVDPHIYYLETLFIENYNFLPTIPVSQIEDFFEYFVENYSSDMVKIIYNKKTVKFKEINSFFNQFFSKYEKITIGYHDDFIIQVLDLEKSILTNEFDDVVTIGKDRSSNIFIAKHSNKNGIFIDELDIVEDFSKADSSYENIYYYLVSAIFTCKQFSLSDIYKEFKNEEKD